MGSRTAAWRWRRKRRAVLAAAGWTCACGRLATEVHHRLPVSRGGTDDEANLEAVCETCHKLRHHPPHPVVAAWDAEIARLMRANPR